MTVALPEIVDVAVPLGGRVLVIADMLLGRESTPSSEVAAAEVANALASWDGPGVVILAGGFLDLLGDDRCTVAAALDAHPRLAAALRAFAQSPDHDGARRAICLPGAADGRLAWDESAQRALRDEAGIEVALTVDIVATTGEGERRVRVEAGHRFDPRFARTDPCSPVETPFGSHVITDVVPALDPRWARGADRLVDVADLPRFIASRMLYRRIAWWWWLLAVPFLVALLVRLPVSFALRRLDDATRRFALVGITTAIDFAVILAGAAILVTRGWRAVAGPRREQGPDDVARAEARRLLGEGYAGLVVGHTRAPELADLGSGFFAAAGAAAELTVERNGRLGLPSVFVPARRIDWVEIEAGARLHARLLHSETDATGATVIERLLGQRSDAPERPGFVATWPGGSSWPAVQAPLRQLTRVRRTAAFAIAACGIVDLASAITPPLQERLRFVLRAVPLAVPETATALVAAAGLGLIVLARGVRRGQRDPWRIALGLLAGTVALHVVKGADIEEAVAAAVVGGYLVLHRAAFRARTHRAALREGLLRLLVALVAVVAGGALTVEVVTGANRDRLSLPDALQAVLQRMVGITDIALPDRLDDFLAPTLVVLAVGFLVWLLWLAIRPAVARRAPADTVARARQLVNKWAGGTLDYFALRDDKQLFVWESTVVAYAVHHGVCLLSPDPIGPDWERDGAWTAFRRFTDDHGWSVAVLGAGEDWLPTYHATGMHDLYVGDEAVVDVHRFTLDGGRYKALRQAVNRVANKGYTISFHDPSVATEELQIGVREVMGKSRRGDVERGFSMTLGRIFDPADSGLLLAVCHGPDGEPVAFCQYVPAPGINGFSLDLMRRDAGEHPNGLLDFVIVETIRHLKATGYDRLGLNFATMRAVLAGEMGAGIVGSIERWALKRMSGSMQIESLWRFNAKFDPDWTPRYVVYDSPEHLVPVAFAIARAESFWELPVIGRWLVPSGES